MPNTPRNQNYSPIKPPNFGDTPTRSTQQPVQQAPAHFLTNTVSSNQSQLQQVHLSQPQTHLPQPSQTHQQHQIFSESHSYTTNQTRQ